MCPLHPCKRSTSSRRVRRLDHIATFIPKLLFFAIVLIVG